MWNVELINILHSGETRTTADAFLQLSHRRRVAGGDDLDSPISQVAHPPPYIQIVGITGDEPAKPDTLYTAGDKEPDRALRHHPAPPSLRRILRM